MLGVADSPDTPVIAASGWDPVVGDITPRAEQLKSLLAQGYRVVVAADVAASTERLARLLAEHGVDLPISTDELGLDEPGGRIVAVPLEQGAILRRPGWRCCPNAT